MRVLLIEDDVDHRELMRRALTEHDSTWQVVEAVSGEEALRRLAGGETFNLVLLDYTLPGRDGLAVLKEIRRGAAALPVVVVTGRGDEKVAVAAMKGGASDYVVKNEGYLQLLPLVARRAREAHKLAADRKQAEEALRESEERYRRLVENAPDVIYSLAEDGTIISLNPAFERITGWSRAEWLGKPFMPIVHPDDLNLARERFHQILRGEAIPPSELRILSKSGSYVIGEFGGAPNIEKGKVVGEIGTARDITERKRVEGALKNFSRRIMLVREKEKKKISENIHLSIGHIAGAINLLVDTVERNIKSKNMEAIQEGCQKFKPIFHEFVSNLRNLTHDLRPPELEILGLASVLSNYLSNIEKETGLKVEFRSDVDEKKIQIDTPIILFRIVQEAVNNILKHSQANRVRVGLKLARSMIILTIKDNGRGFIPMKDNKDGESGLGLRLIRRMVESMDGTFEIHSLPGKGTELSVSLPSAKPPNPEPASRKRKR